MGMKDWEAGQEWWQLATPATVAAHRGGTPSARQRAEKAAIEAHLWVRHMEAGPYTREAENTAKAVFEAAYAAFLAFGPKETVEKAVEWGLPIGEVEWTSSIGGGFSTPTTVVGVIPKGWTHEGVSAFVEEGRFFNTRWTVTGACVVKAPAPTPIPAPVPVPTPAPIPAPVPVPTPTQDVVEACAGAGYAGFVPVNAAIVALKTAMVAFENGDYSGKGQSKRYQAAKASYRAAYEAAVAAYTAQTRALGQGYKFGLLTEEQAEKATTSLQKLKTKILALRPEF